MAPQTSNEQPQGHEDQADFDDYPHGQFNEFRGLYLNQLKLEQLLESTHKEDEIEDLRKRIESNEQNMKEALKAVCESIVLMPKEKYHITPGLQRALDRLDRVVASERECHSEENIKEMLKLLEWVNPHDMNHPKDYIWYPKEYTEVDIAEATREVNKDDTEQHNVSNDQESLAQES